MNPVLIILLLGAGAFYFTKGNSPQEIEKEILKCSIKVLTLDSLDLEGFSFMLRLTVAIDNPTGQIYTAIQPDVKVSYKGVEIKSTLPSGVTIEVKAQTRTLIKNIQLSLPLANTILTDSFFPANVNNEWTIETATTINGVAIKGINVYKISDYNNIPNKK